MVPDLLWLDESQIHSQPWLLEIYIYYFASQLAEQYLQFQAQYMWLDVVHNVAVF